MRLLHETTLSRQATLLAAISQQILEILHLKFRCDKRADIKDQRNAR
jgi:hypothetical protein